MLWRYMFTPRKVLLFQPLLVKLRLSSDELNCSYFFFFLEIVISDFAPKPKQAGSGIMIKQAANPQQLQPLLC